MWQNVAKNKNGDGNMKKTAYYKVLYEKTIVKLAKVLSIQNVE